MDGLVEGRIVEYVLGEGDVPETYKYLVGAIRPAIVLGVCGHTSGCSNLTVFMDWSNDGNFMEYEHQGVLQKSPMPCIWATSVSYSQGLEPRTWHWPTETMTLRAARDARMAAEAAAAAAAAAIPVPVVEVSIPEPTPEAPEVEPVAPAPVA